MSTSTRFAVAIHILTNITLCRGQTVRSEDIARSVNTNPTVVRRILGALAEAGLTYSQMGQGGGALLARPAEAISLLDVYRAVEDQPYFMLHRTRPNDACYIGHAITPVLEQSSRASVTRWKPARRKPASPKWPGRSSGAQAILYPLFTAISSGYAIKPSPIPLRAEHFALL